MANKNGKKQCPTCGKYFVNLGAHQRFCKGKEESRDEELVDELEIVNRRTKCCGAKVKTIYTGGKPDEREVYKVCKSCGKKTKIE